jgi:hypothetical protein
MHLSSRPVVIRIICSYSRHQHSLSLTYPAVSSMAKRKASTQTSKRVSKRVATDNIVVNGNGADSAVIQQDALAQVVKEGLDADYVDEGGEEAADITEVLSSISRPPPVNSSYLPLPWKGRLGYVRTPPLDNLSPRMLTKALTAGMSQHLSSDIKSVRFLVPNLSHCIYPRTSPSTA